MSEELESPKGRYIVGVKGELIEERAPDMALHDGMLFFFYEKNDTAIRKIYAQGAWESLELTEDSEPIFLRAPKKVEDPQPEES